MKKINYATAVTDPSNVNVYALESIADCVAEARKAILKNNNEGRFQLMDTVYDALETMRASISDAPKNKKLADAHRNFYSRMITLVNLVDTTNDLVVVLYIVQMLVSHEPFQQTWLWPFLFFLGESSYVFLLVALLLQADDAPPQDD